MYHIGYLVIGGFGVASSLGSYESCGPEHACPSFHVYVFAFLLGGHLGVEPLVTWQLYFKRLEERHKFSQGQHHFTSPLEENKGSHFSAHLPTLSLPFTFAVATLLVQSGISLHFELHLPDGF